MNKRLQIACLALTVFAVLLSSSRPVIAQSNQMSYSVNLTYLTVQLMYPTVVMPGDSVTINVQANTKSYVDSVSLTVRVLYSDGSNIRQLVSDTLSKRNYYLSKGTSFSKQIQFTVPTDALRTSLFASLTESVQTNYYSYYYYSATYNYSSSNCYYYPDYYYYSGYCSYNYYAYPYYAYSAMSDAGVAPLSYIKATTPEYTSLQSQYQNLEQQLAQSQAENQQLNQSLQNAQNMLAQRDATIASLNQQLNSSQNTTGTLEATALVIAAIAVAAFIALWRKGKSGTKPTTKPTTEVKA